MGYTGRRTMEISICDTLKGKYVEVVRVVRGSTLQVRNASLVILISGLTISGSSRSL